MKKKYFLIFIVSFILILSTFSILTATNTIDIGLKNIFTKPSELSNNRIVIAVVNGKEIYKSEIETQKEILALSKQNGLNQIEAMPIPESEKQALRQQLEKGTKTDEDILKEIIRKTVVFQQATKQGLLSDFDEAYDYAVFLLDNIKNTALATNATETDIANYQAICDYIMQNDLTEEEYLIEIANYYVDESAYENLFANFKENHPHTTDDTTLREQFEKYIDSFIEKADIKLTPAS